eukprot:gnl/TRDRNA2_/TRDRNA2_83945_c0_seq2.p2 gnl/TRDRNA2_/TRDRNA2_83945_c0~~gnl/TRDRNA2_/TRDRNA2_83945_c0_seq2.p2  ORF type:complete len:143 (+),score=41.51 gnl/TRDRNA2_/TRDRNA2_83945_c0_seq2:82-510(+)
MRSLLVIFVLINVAAGARKKAQFWPFTSWSSEDAAPKPVVQSLRPAAPVKRVEDTKQALLSSEVFLKKTAVLCQNANADDQANCEKVAGERLFCTMFTRHEEKFKGMQGEEEQKQRCSQTDIMTTAAEQAKNEREEEEALKN